MCPFLLNHLAPHCEYASLSIMMRSHASSTLPSTQLPGYQERLESITPTTVVDSSVALSCADSGHVWRIPGVSGAKATISDQRAHKNSYGTVSITVLIAARTLWKV